MIVVATTNKHKLREIEQILKVRVKGQAIRVKEDQKTFEGNAIKKAKAALKKTGQTSLADDSGLEVKCLDGKPGIRSARFAGPNPTSEKFCKKLLRVMKNSKNRRAQFVCVIAIAYPNGRVKTVKGVCKGKIILEMKGNKGFGYDPVFVPQGYKKTFSEMSSRTKNRLSHRGKALRKFKQLVLKNR